MLKQLTYLQLSSSVSPSFWNKLTELKLNVDKLNETSRHIWGYFSIIPNKDCPQPILEVDSTSFNSDFNGQNIYIPFHGKLLNKNTIETFKECDKMDLINAEGKVLYANIMNGEVLKDPSLLNCFFILSFADLKKYHYYYWFAYPVPKEVIIEKSMSSSITDELSTLNVESFYEAFKKLDDNQKPYFLVEKLGTKIEVCKLSSKLKNVTPENVDKFYFAFFNISHDTSLIGSQLRNYVTLILHFCNFLQGKSANFIEFNLTRNGSHISCSQSMVYKLNLPKWQNDNITWVGWEKNERDKMGPRMANMKNTLDPLVLADNAIDLNLKLIKWRILPGIDLDKIKHTKCLLLGSGTLGCSVARGLLAWGARYITFVDNSNVSFSNPVRQTLFTYQDSVEMKPKPYAAADNLRTIFPGVISKGIQLTIPMPGHTVGESMLDQTKENVNKLIEQIISHDIIFLLTDSRESRWLPTLLGSVHGKLIINAALGFDTYLVMRHGLRDETANLSTWQKPISHLEGFKTITGTELGCYFCNDVTAPGNSLKDRTLDQQCTVTRPGVSQMAGALAVELAISVLQHKDGPHAPAFYSTSVGVTHEDLQPENESLLGVVPHSIRGFLSSFEHIRPATQKYKNCVACSEMVIQEYKKNGMDFLLKVFNSSKHLEDVALLTEMFHEANFGDVLEFSDEDF